MIAKPTNKANFFGKLIRSVTQYALAMLWRMPSARQAQLSAQLRSAVQLCSLRCAAQCWLCSAEQPALRCAVLS